MINIGKYQIDNFVGDGRISVSWKENGRNFRAIISQPETMVEEWIAKKTKHYFECEELFRLAYTNSDAFFDKLGKNEADELIRLMDGRIIPGVQYTGRQLFEFHVREFAKAYRKKYNIDIKDEQLMMLVEDMANDF